MGSAGKAVTNLAKSVGVVKEVPQSRQLAEPATAPESVEKVAMATTAEKAAAARRRARRSGRRSLLSGGRLGSAAEDEGTQTTLGA
jgi:hypothetical protein